MKLCLLVSRRCNLRCAFCRVRFTGEDMGWETASLAVERYLEGLPAGETPRVKFFGGEPLLNFGLIRRVVEAGRGGWAEKGMLFEVSTNGSYLDGRKLDYLRRRPEVEVTVSQVVPGGAPLPGVWFTLVLDRDCTPASVLARLRALVRAGYRRFNFLPAYFVEWSEEDLSRLKRCFIVIARVMEGLRRAGEPVRVKNLEMWSPVPLYNNALTVDVDGSFYASNIIQCEGTEKYRPLLALGSARNPRWAPEAAQFSGGRLQAIVAHWAGAKAWESTKRVDRALTDFVGTIRAG